MFGYHNYIISKIERWRFKNRSFKFMVETILINKYTEIYRFARNLIINGILKKYLSKSIFAHLKKYFGPKDWELKFK